MSKDIKWNKLNNVLKSSIVVNLFVFHHAGINNTFDYSFY